MQSRLKQTALKLIRLYQAIISPLLARHCRFYPTCSDYLALSIEKYGLGKGLCLGIKRIIRCQPLSKGGVDLP